MNQRDRKDYVTSAKRVRALADDLHFVAGELWNKKPTKELELFLRLMNTYHDEARHLVEMIAFDLDERLQKIERWLIRSPKADHYLFKRPRRRRPSSVPTRKR